MPEVKPPEGRYWGNAYRDTADQKPDFEGYMNPLVIEAFGLYMMKHQYQSDGRVRESDNWQALFGEDHVKVCMSSLWRHFMDVWKWHRGYETRDGIDEALGGLLFNGMCIWYKLLLDRRDNANKG